MRNLKLYFIFTGLLGAFTIDPMNDPLSLKLQCVKAIGARRNEIPQLREQILNYLPSELQLLIISYLQDYDFAIEYAHNHAINQDMADFIVKKTPGLIQKIIDDPSLKSIFPKKALNRDNDIYLAWALYRQFIENQVRKNFEKRDREFAYLEKLWPLNEYYNQSMREVLEKQPKKPSESWYAGDKHFLSPAKVKNKNHEMVDMVLKDESNMPLALFKKYPASFEGHAFSNADNTLFVLAHSSKLGYKLIVNPESGLQIFALDNSASYPRKLFLTTIVSVCFSNDMSNKILIETEAGDTYEFEIPLKAYEFIKNITPESAAALLVYQHLEKLVINFANVRNFVNKEYDLLNENIEKMLLNSEAIEENDYLLGKYYDMHRHVDVNFNLERLFRDALGLSQRRQTWFGLPKTITISALASVIIAFSLLWMQES